MVDSVASHSVKHFAKHSIAPCLLLALPITLAMSLLDPEFYVGTTVVFLLGWMVLAPLFLGAFSYGLQTRNAIAPSGLPNLLANSLIFSAAFVAFMHLLTVYQWSQHCFYSKSIDHAAQFSIYQICAQLILFGPWLIAMVILRKCARYALRYRLNSVPNRPKLMGIGPKNRWVPVWSTNPVVVRERQRLQKQISAGLVGSLVWHFPTLICSCLVIVQQHVIAIARPEHYVIAMLAVGLAQFTRALWTSLPRIVSEIENRDFESMLSTKLTPLQYQFGWTQVILVPMAVDTLFSLAAILATAHHQNHMMAVLVPASVCLSAPVLGVLMGLCASCASNRTSANQQLVVVLTSFLFTTWQGGLIENQITLMLKGQDVPGCWTLFACIWCNSLVFAWLTARQLRQRWLNLPQKRPT